MPEYRFDRFEESIIANLDEIAQFYHLREFQNSKDNYGWEYPTFSYPRDYQGPLVINVQKGKSNPFCIQTPPKDDDFRNRFLPSIIRELQPQKITGWQGEYNIDELLEGKV